MCNDHNSPTVYFNKVVIDLQLLRKADNIKDIERKLEEAIIELDNIKINGLYTNLVTWEM